MDNNISIKLSLDLNYILRGPIVVNTGTQKMCFRDLLG